MADFVLKQVVQFFPQTLIIKEQHEDTVTREFITLNTVLPGWLCFEYTEVR